jgi:hypothetical protein
VVITSFPTLNLLLTVSITRGHTALALLFSQEKNLMQSTQDEIEVEGEEIDEKSVEEPAASATAQTTEARSEDEEPPTLAEDPYEFERCAITASVVWLPTDDHPAGRQMLVGVRSHLDAPILRVFREAELPLVQLPRLLEALLEELRAELPSRQVERLRRGAAEAQKRPGTRQRAPTASKPDTPSQIASNLPAKGQVSNLAQLNLFQALTQSPTLETQK